MSATIVVLDPLAQPRMDRLRPLVPDGFVLTTTKSRDLEDQLAGVRDADFAITGDVPVTAQMMRLGAEHRLKAVHKWGVGYDNIDLGAARDAGVRVMRTTGSNALAVAETALAMILALNRAIVAGHDGIARGEWLKGALGPSIFLLSGKTVGLVGLGFIGKALARMLAGFGCRILYAKPTPLSDEDGLALGAHRVDFPTLLAESDIVSIHAALNEDTKSLIGAKAFAAMKEGVLFINTARAEIVDEVALAAALDNGQVRGAGLDVFAVEPIPADHPLRGRPNVILTPHIGAQASENFAKTVTRMFDNIRAVAEGREPPALDVLV
ncbi:MAG: 2-hydroxyacid dehydrogenase [Pseudomonadota bacterium]